MPLIDIMDGYADRPTTRRAALEQRMRALKARHWADPSDADLLEQIAELQDELAALDADTSGSAA